MNPSRNKRILWLALLLVPVLAFAGPTEIGSEQIVSNPLAFIAIFFVLSFVIGVVTVIAGVGGGVVFTPLLLGFTCIDSYIVRATGLLIAMAGALVVAKPFLRRGIANIRLLLWTAAPYSLFSIVGAVLAKRVDSMAGPHGEALIRGGLGVMVIGVAILFLRGGKKAEYPEGEEAGDFTRSLGLGSSYWEDSLGKSVSYDVTRAAPSLGLFCLIGLMSGFFGVGGGWAMVPLYNLFMGLPLKAAAVCSRVLISMGGAASIWPYVMGGGLITLFAVPCMAGAILGSMVGAKIMLRIKAGAVRYIVIGIMFLTGARLIVKACSTWG
jgi:uncharacterized membrane protein YfcA